MSLDLDSFDDDDLDEWCNDVGNCGMPPPKLQPIYDKIGRSLDEILQLEVQIIEECTDAEPEIWVRLYWEKFRSILTDDPTLTKHQVKYLLYMK